jgi:hypothetical protein
MQRFAVGPRVLHACPCRDAEIVAQQEAVERMAAASVQAAAERTLGETGARLIAGLTLDTFDGGLLTADEPAAHPLQIVADWLSVVQGAGRSADYRDPNGPPACLYFYSPGKGRGKTHLAAAAFHEIKRTNKLAVFIEELSYLRRRWGCGFDAVESVVNLPGDRAFLTVIDDLGQRQGGKNVEAVSDVWYEVINMRWLMRGWTIITSNFTPEELWEKGTLNAASYSRLRQMTRGQIITFNGSDQRQREVGR